MRCHGVQILLATLLVACHSHFLPDALDGYPGLRRDFYEGPPVPHPLAEPLPSHHHFLPPHRPLYREDPYLYHAPPQTIIVPVGLRGVFPPFIERIVQRIQTYWSIYNPLETQTFLPPTRPPPTTYTTTQVPKKVTTTTTTTVTPSSSTTAKPETTEKATEDSELVTTTTATPEESSTKVSTLAVFEVTPSTSEEAPAETTAEGATTVPPDINADTEEPVFITPEKASLLGQKDAFLRYLQTGKIPPYLESDRINEMDDIFS